MSCGSAAPVRILIPGSIPRPVLRHEMDHQWVGAAVTSESETSGWPWEGFAAFSDPKARLLGAIFTHPT